MVAVIDETGRVYGRLLVLSRVPQPELSKNGLYRVGAFWLCQCSCGNKTIANATSLRRGATKSCGCLRKTSGQHSAARAAARRARFEARAT